MFRRWNVRGCLVNRLLLRSEAKVSRLNSFFLSLRLHGDSQLVCRFCNQVDFIARASTGRNFGIILSCCVMSSRRRRTVSLFWDDENVFFMSPKQVYWFTISKCDGYHKWCFSNIVMNIHVSVEVQSSLKVSYRSILLHGELLFCSLQ